MQTIFIPQNPQYGIIVEDPKRISNSIYYEVYRNASRSVRDIIESNNRDVKSYPQERFINTTVSFTGERGTGKSSAMLTFAHLLYTKEDVRWRSAKPDGKEEKEDTEFKGKVWETIRRQNYFVLKAVDSTQMGEKERLIGALSAKMYQEYRIRSENGSFSASVTTDDRRRFLELAAKVNRLAYMYCSGAWFKDGDSITQDLTEIEALRCIVKDLVRSFLKLVLPDSAPGSAYLVVSIDDLDMNLSNSYEIVDEIRKFLTVKNVIVLTSVCIPQLKDVISKNFRTAIQDQSGDKGVILLAQRYIEKIFPVSRQHAMPLLTTEQLNQYSIGNLLGRSGRESAAESAAKRADIGLSPVYKEAYMSVADGVLHLIYRKTLLLLVPEECGRHWLIPNNMRQLCNFIHLLQEMDDVAMIYDGDKKRWRLRADVEFDDSTWDTLDTNLNRLMMYIADGLLDFDAAQMSDDDIGMARTLALLIQDMPGWTLKTLNKKIVRDILTYVDERSDNSVYRQILKREHYGPILNASRFPSLISMGDVMYVLGLLSTRSNDYTIKRLVEYVRVIWSIKMTRELYCVGIRKQVPSNGDGGLYITEDFRKAVGAMMVNPDCREFIAYNKEKVISDMKSGNEVTKNVFYDTDWIWSTEKNISDQDKEILGSIVVKNTLRREKVPGNAGVEDAIRSDWREIEKTVVEKQRRYDAYLNYISLFTNILSPGAITDVFYKGASTAVKDMAARWQKDNVMVFPFYSMDWMNRFYSLVKEEYNHSQSVAEGVVKGISNFVEMIELVLLNRSVNMPGILMRYIPVEVDDSNKTFLFVDVDFLKRFKSLCKDSESLGGKVANALAVLLDESVGNKIKKLVERETRTFKRVLNGDRSAENAIAMSLKRIYIDASEILDEKPVLQKEEKKKDLAKLCLDFKAGSNADAIEAYRAVLKRIKTITSKW